MNLEEDQTESSRTETPSTNGQPDPEDIEIEPEESITIEKCEQLREDIQNMDSYMRLADQYSLPAWDIVAHIRGDCECNATVDAVTSDKPWTEKELVEELFIEQNYHFTEIAELFGCHHETVKNWARDHHEITIVDDSIRTSSKTVRKLQRIGIQNEEDIDLPPEARESPFDE